MGIRWGQRAWVERGPRLGVVSVLAVVILMLSSCGGAAGLPSVLVPLSAAPNMSPTSPGSFTIQLRLPDESFSLAQQQILHQAAQRWMQVIVGDVEDVSLTLPQGACLAGVPGISQRIDDLLIDVTLVELDGIGGVLARAGPCAVRQGSLIPAYGIVQLDGADADLLQQQEQLLAAVLHEFGHVLGFGSLWPLRQLIQGLGSADPRYLGLQGNAAFQGLESQGNGGERQVPIENQGGAGMRDSHWRESVLGSELMTGALDLGPAVLSLVTAGAMADLGYRIDPQPVDPFELPLPQLSSERLQADLATSTARVIQEAAGPDPIWVISPAGERIESFSLL